MSYAADRTEDAEQAAPAESATQNADAPQSAAEVIVASSTELPVTSADPASADEPAAVSDEPAGTEPVASAPDVAPPPVEPWPVDLPADVVDLARAAAAADAGTADRVGEHVDSIAEDQVARTVRFAALDAGYRGWQWSVTLALLPDEPPTVSEVVLLPGPDALVAPAWLPWDRRLRPGDLGPTDLLPAAPDDPRLVPGYVESDDPAIEALATEVGLGRERVLSREGRDEAAERWHDGPFGPGSPIAKAAPALCGTCGFYAPLAGSLGGAFGVCANEFSPADARVVDVQFGCGAHSEVPAPPPAVPMGGTVLDEVTLEVHDRPRPASEAAGQLEDSAQLEDAGQVEDAVVGDPDAVAPDSGPIDPEPTGPESIDQVPDATPLTDAAETAPTLDVAEVADPQESGPPVPAANAEGAAPDAHLAAVAVEPETVSAAGEVSGSRAEIVVVAADVDGGVVDGQDADDAAEPPATEGPAVDQPAAELDPTAPATAESTNAVPVSDEPATDEADAAVDPLEHAGGVDRPTPADSTESADPADGEPTTG